MGSSELSQHSSGIELATTHTLLVGVEDDPSGMLRAYLGHRAAGLYALVEDPEAQEAIRAAWAGGDHVTITKPPPECIYQEGES